MATVANDRIPVKLHEFADFDAGPTEAERAEFEAEIARMRYEQEHSELLQQVAYLRGQEDRLTREVVTLKAENASMSRRLENLPDPTEPRLSFVDLLGVQAAWYRSWGTLFGSGCAGLFEQAAGHAKLTSATTWAELEVRLEVLERTRGYDLFHRGETQGYSTALDQMCAKYPD